MTTRPFVRKISAFYLTKLFNSHSSNIIHVLLSTGTFGSLKLDSKFFVEVDQATLYSVEIDAQHKVNLKVQKQPVSLSTGVAWSLDNKKMYYIDCSTRKVTVFDYDLEKGTIGE